MTGYWFLDSPIDYRSPQGLEEFLQAGPPPVYLGFGSILTGDAQKLTDLVLDGLALAN